MLLWLPARKDYMSIPAVVKMSQYEEPYTLIKQRVPLPLSISRSSYCRCQGAHCSGWFITWKYPMVIGHSRIPVIIKQAVLRRELTIIRYSFSVLGNDHADRAKTRPNSTTLASNSMVLGWCWDGVCSGFCFDLRIQPIPKSWTIETEDHYKGCMGLCKWNQLCNA